MFQEKVVAIYFKEKHQQQGCQEGTIPTIIFAVQFF